MCLKFDFGFKTKASMQSHFLVLLQYYADLSNEYRRKARLLGSKTARKRYDALNITVHTDYLFSYLFTSDS